ncbi:WD repeat-containing protein 87 [Podochytrium sp. JEL0797]|nr:WD repeat-containing protein 87 [Podochytrium sp. JEL0797]
MRHDTFLHYSPEGIEVWNLNSFWSTFSATGSQVTHLKRIEGCCSDPARILVATEDKSMHILSPVSGSTLFTAFPNIADIIIKEIEHDYPSATIWMLNSVGEISVYTTQTNPARIVDIWEVEAGSERLVSMCALRKRYNCNTVTDPVYALLGKHQVIIQAHASAVVAVGCYTDLMTVISLGSDLPNALNDIILPQLDLMNDESWQVRAQLSSNMAAYNINHPDIVMALIGRLTDKNVNVKNAAMNSLATFGISSKEAFRNAMAKDE